MMKLRVKMVGKNLLLWTQMQILIINIEGTDAIQLAINHALSNLSKDGIYTKDIAMVKDSTADT